MSAFVARRFDSGWALVWRPRLRRLRGVALEFQHGEPPLWKWPKLTADHLDGGWAIAVGWRWTALMLHVFLEDSVIAHTSPNSNPCSSMMTTGSTTACDGGASLIDTKHLAGGAQHDD